MAQVSSRVSGTNTTLAIGIERALVESVTRVLDVYFALRSEQQPVTGRASGQAQSIMSMPMPAYSTISSGVPTPIR